MSVWQWALIAAAAVLLGIIVILVFRTEKAHAELRKFNETRADLAARQEDAGLDDDSA